MSLSYIYLKDVNNLRFSQSDYDTRFWIHGLAASTQCLQALSLHSRLPGAGLHATSIVKLSASVKKTLFEKAALRKISPKLCPKCLWLDSQLTEPVNAGPESLLLLTSL